MKTKPCYYWVLLLTLCISGSVITPSKAFSQTKNDKHFKVLYIMSYHSPWEWTDSMFQGFKDVLFPYKVEYKTFQMDTKRKSSEFQKEAAGRKARQLIDSWKPDLVFTSDDDVQKYVTKHYINKSTPFVFCAVNGDPKECDFINGSNITGVLEIEHFVESVKLLKKIVPHVQRIAVVLDDGPMWEPVVKRMKEKLKQLPDVQFVCWDTILTFKNYQQKMKAYTSTVDAVALLGIFTFKDQNRVNVPYQDVLRWTAENCKLPDFSFWKDRVTFGTLCVVSVSGYEQGLAAGKIAKQILVDGKSPSNFVIKATTKGEPLISLARAKRLGIKIDTQVLLTSKVVTRFAWEN